LSLFPWRRRGEAEHGPRARDDEEGGARGDGATGKEEKEEGAPAESSRAAAAEVVLAAMEMRRGRRTGALRLRGVDLRILRAGPASDYGKKRLIFEKKKSLLMTIQLSKSDLIFRIGPRSGHIFYSVK
jgi:hypothetical protein